MALEGDLALFRLPDILQVVAQQRKTGILTVQGVSDILALNFSDGEIVAADALNQSFEDLLGGVLDARGVVPSDRYAQLVEDHRSSGERLVDFLVDSGAASRDEVLDALRELTYRLLVDVLGWREGQFKFYGGEEVAFEEGIRPLKVDEVLMRSLGDLPAAGRAVASPRAVLAYLRVRDDRPIRPIPDSFDEQTPLESGVVWVTPDERVVLERLDGRTPAEKLARDSGLGESRFLYALYRLLQAGLIRPVESGEELPTAPVVRGPAPPRPAKVEALSYDRPRTPETPISPEVPDEPFVSWLEGTSRWGLVAAGLAIAILGWWRPGGLLVPAGDAEVRETYDRLLDLSRFEVIDRAARTYHLLEGRYPSSLEDLVSRGLAPARVRRDPDGHGLVMRSEADQYRLDVVSLAEEDEVRREGVYGDFFLDRELFAGLDVDPGIPLVLID